MNEIKNNLDWEIIYASEPVFMYRMKMPKGWLIKHEYIFAGLPRKIDIAYVNDDKHEWEI